MRPLVAVALTCAVVAGAHGAHASGFLDKLKGAVDQVTGGTSGGGTAGVSGLSTEQIVAGLKEALRVGSERVVAQVGAKDGFNADPKIHIPLPENLKKVQDTLGKIGLAGLADDVELRINRAAEEAAPKTKELLWKAINGMSLDDAKNIYNGPNDAATQYFRKTTSGDLRKTVEPIVDKALNEVGAITAYESLMSKYKAIPFVPDVKSDIKSHATDKTLDGIFHYLANEEASIRENPVARTTDILKTVFGKS